MIKRTIYKQILNTIDNRPVTLITGARQVGKTTICKELVKDRGFNYVSLDNLRERKQAIDDPEMFLKLHTSPLIIDEVQYAPELFDAIEAIVNEKKFRDESNYGMYVLTGSQSYNLMQGITQSMAGRIGIIEMSTLSFSEIKKVDEKPFEVDIIKIQKRIETLKLNTDVLYKTIIKGFYPELYNNPNLDEKTFYSDYVQTYIERDVSQILNVKDKLLFQNFLELLASITGEELIYANISKTLGVTINTIKSWVSILAAGSIITLIEPYNESSIIKRIVKRPKIIFNDTGLASYLAGFNDAETLKRSRFAGHFVETYIINEILKSYKNNNEPCKFYYYRDSNQNEIDLLMLKNGVLTPIECKTGVKFNETSVKGFKQINDTKYDIGTACVLCNTEAIYKIKDNIYAIPISSI